MNPSRILSLSTLSLAVLSACLIATGAQAGMLGGSGSLGGAVGPRGADLSGQGRATVTRDAAVVPKVADKARDGAAQAREAQGAAKAKAADTRAEAKADAKDKPADAKASASVSGEASVKP